MESFSRLGLAEPLSQALASFGFESPTPVQAETIPAILSRRDVIVESETGTGKTFAYLAPAFQLVSILERKGTGEPLAIVAAPTQELAVQIGREAERLAKAAAIPAKTVVLLGGTPLEKQAAKLKAKPEIVVGTLGRLADLVSLGKLRTSSLKLLVLDEADRLFARETEELARALLKSAPSSAVRVLVSATIPERLRREMRPLLREAIEICPVGESVISSDIEHWCFYCDGRKRLDFARRFEASVHPERCLMFLSMATSVEKAALALAHLGLPIEAIHSGMDKETRRVALDRFTKGEVRYLLTSDLGARGLDIAGISHVISLDLPEEPTIYTHRAGRTGRAGAKGVSIVLADGVELARASKIATKGGFVFRCKVLEEGQVLEPTSQEFFARVEAFEQQRMAAKAGQVGDGERRSGGGGRKSGGGSRKSSGGSRESGGGANRERAEPRRGAEQSPYADRPRRAFPEPKAGEIEAPRSARKPVSAPWRPRSESESSGPANPHKLLHKKGDIKPIKAPAEARPRLEKPPRPEASTRKSQPRREERPREKPTGVTPRKAAGVTPRKAAGITRGEPTGGARRISERRADDGAKRQAGRRSDQARPQADQRGGPPNRGGPPHPHKGPGRPGEQRAGGARPFGRGAPGSEAPKSKRPPRA
jgi:superfamily II DNA/RNA helicase